jgi:SAM-dependent methyltransferase
MSPLLDDAPSLFPTLTAQIDSRTARTELGAPYEILTGSFWTARQRQANALHEVPYRACFKPQLPAYFIERFTRPGDLVLDPFMGRGTTALEAAFADRVPCGGDLNPLSLCLVRPRLDPMPPEAVASALQQVNLAKKRDDLDEDLLVFYHPRTLTALYNLRDLCAERADHDPLWDWIRMVTLTRLTGHSTGFLSVYTLPPNQAVSVSSQRRINKQRCQVPPDRPVLEILARKSKALWRDLDATSLRRLKDARQRAQLWNGPADLLPLKDNSVALTVTSPPFLDVVKYEDDNWLRAWFAKLPTKVPGFSLSRRTDDWSDQMRPVFQEIHRVLRPGGRCAFEIGEVGKGKILLEEAVIPLGEEVGLEIEALLLNEQRFTKTAHCWGVANGRKGTNTNRIVMLRKRD